MDRRTNSTILMINWYTGGEQFLSGEMYHQGIQNIKNAKQRREVYRLKGQQQKKSSNSQLLLIDITSITSVRSHEIFLLLLILILF